MKVENLKIVELLATVKGILDAQLYACKHDAEYPMEVDLKAIAEAKCHLTEVELLLGVQPNSEPQPQLQQTHVSLSLPPFPDDERIAVESITQSSKEVGVGAISQVYFRKGAKWMRGMLGGNAS